MHYFKAYLSSIGDNPNANRLFPLDRNDSLNETIREMSEVTILINPYGEDAATTYNAIQEFIS